MILITIFRHARIVDPQMFPSDSAATIFSTVTAGVGHDKLPRLKAGFDHLRKAKRNSYPPITFFIKPITSGGWFKTSLASASISSP